MPMVVIMNVRVRVIHLFMRVIVLMALGQVQPDTQCHASGGGSEEERRAFPKDEE